MALLIVVFPAGADAGSEGSSTTLPVAPSAGAGRVIDTAVTAPPNEAREPADKAVEAHTTSTAPTSPMKSATEAQAVVVAATAPAQTNDRPENGGGTGNEDETVGAGDAMTLPTATLTVAPSTVSGVRTEDDAPGKTAGGGATASNRTAVLTATTPASSGWVQSWTGGDGASPIGPGGREATATPSAGEKAGSTGTPTPTDTSTTTLTGAGSVSAGVGQSPQRADVRAKGNRTTAGTGSAEAGSDGKAQATLYPHGAPTAPAVAIPKDGGTATAATGEAEPTARSGLRVDPGTGGDSNLIVLRRPVVPGDRDRALERYHRLSGHRPLRTGRHGDRGGPR